MITNTNLSYSYTTADKKTLFHGIAGRETGQPYRNSTGVIDRFMNLHKSIPRTTYAEKTIGDFYRFFDKMHLFLCTIQNQFKGFLVKRPVKIGLNS